MKLQERTKQWITFGVTMTGALLIFLWSFYFNRGTLIVEAEPPFTMEIVGVKSSLCLSSPCFRKIISGYREIIFSKEGKFQETQTVYIPRIRSVRQEVSWRFRPVVSFLPPEIKKKKKTSKLEKKDLFFENESLTLFHKGEVVTTFYDIEDPLVKVAGENFAWVLSNTGDLFRIDLLKKRKQLFSRNVLEVLPSMSSEMTVLRTVDATKIIQPHEASEISIPFIVFPFSIVWSSDEKSLYFFNEKEGKAQLTQFFLSGAPAVSFVDIEGVIPNDPTLSADEKTIEFYSDQQKLRVRFRE